MVATNAKDPTWLARLTQLSQDLGLYDDEEGEGMVAATVTLDSLFALIEERGWVMSLGGPYPPYPLGLGPVEWVCHITELSSNKHIGKSVAAESALAAVTQAIRQAERATGGR